MRFIVRDHDVTAVSGEPALDVKSILTVVFPYVELSAGIEAFRQGGELTHQHEHSWKTVEPVGQTLLIVFSKVRVPVGGKRRVVRGVHEHEILPGELESIQELREVERLKGQSPQFSPDNSTLQMIGLVPQQSVLRVRTLFRTER